MSQRELDFCELIPGEVAGSPGRGVGGRVRLIAEWDQSKASNPSAVIAGCGMSLPVTTATQNDSGILKDQPAPTWPLFEMLDVPRLMNIGGRRNRSIGIRLGEIPSL